MRNRFAGLVASIAVLLTALPSIALAQTAPATSTSTQSGFDPSAVTAQAAPAGADQSALTPEQQAALQAAIIKAAQNPVGNIAIIPFQNNFNYGFGPYQRLQYNLNIQPVVPIMLSPSLNLIARVITPIINQPSFAPPTVVHRRMVVQGRSGLGTSTHSSTSRQRRSPMRSSGARARNFCFRPGRRRLSAPASTGLVPRSSV